MIAAVSDGLRIELDPLGVSVSLIEPGLVATNFHEANREKTVASTEAEQVYSHLYTEKKVSIQFSSHAPPPTCLCTPSPCWLDSNRGLRLVCSPTFAWVSAGGLEADRVQGVAAVGRLGGHPALRVEHAPQAALPLRQCRRPARLGHCQRRLVPPR
jgi:NAD(P)-dependent dehydrogenase (short-subunit alcohol dehydrogenase family)